MKTTCRLFAIALFLFAAHSARGVVGYYNYRFYAGDNLFHDNLLGTANNNLSTVFGNAAPVGTTISLWNPVANAFDITSEYIGGSLWTIDLVLPVGIGAKLTTTSTFTNIFVGEVRNRAGAAFADGEELLPAPLFSGPNGIYLLGDKLPVASSGTDLFLNTLGRAPNIGEQFTRLNASSQTYITSTYLGGGSWDIVPSIGIGEAGFFNVGPVPEPSAIAFALLGLGGVRIASRRRR